MNTHENGLLGTGRPGETPGTPHLACWGFSRQVQTTDPRVGVRGESEGDVREGRDDFESVARGEGGEELDDDEWEIAQVLVVERVRGEALLAVLLVELVGERD